MSEDDLVFAFDHVVLTVSDIDKTCDWYERVLCLRRVLFDGEHVALHFGSHKINLHPAASPYAPHATLAAPGTADLCLLTPRSLRAIGTHLEEQGVAIEVGPISQTGARGAMESLYIRDPDGNLIEIAHYPSGS